MVLTMEPLNYVWWVSTNFNSWKQSMKQMWNRSHEPSRIDTKTFICTYLNLHIMFLHKNISTFLQLVFEKKKWGQTWFPCFMPLVDDQIHTCTILLQTIIPIRSCLLTVSSPCSTRGTCCVTIVINPVINHELVNND